MSSQNCLPTSLTSHSGLQETIWPHLRLRPQRCSRDKVLKCRKPHTGALFYQKLIRHPILEKHLQKRIKYRMQIWYWGVQEGQNSLAAKTKTSLYRLYFLALLHSSAGCRKWTAHLKQESAEMSRPQISFQVGRSVFLPASIMSAFFFYWKRQSWLVGQHVNFLFSSENASISAKL